MTELSKGGTGTDTRVGASRSDSAYARPTAAINGAPLQQVNLWDHPPVQFTPAASFVWPGLHVTNYVLLYTIPPLWEPDFQISRI